MSENVSRLGGMDIGVDYLRVGSVQKSPPVLTGAFTLVFRTGGHPGATCRLQKGGWNSETKSGERDFVHNQRFDSRK